MSLSHIERHYLDQVPLDSLPARRTGPLVTQKMTELGMEQYNPGSLKQNEGSRLLEAESPSKGFFSTNIQPCVAELLGTALFVFAGTASVVHGDSSLLTVALAHGLALGLVISGVSHCSGGHINPVVTLGVLISGSIKPLLAGAYVICQLIGGMLGAALCRGILSYKPDPYPVNLSTEVTQYELINGGAHALGGGVSPGCGVLCEIILTLILVMTVLMTAVDSISGKPFAGVLIGLSVAVDIMAGGTVSGASMNPARALGPAVVMSDLNSDVWNDHWIYWVGPIGGALIAGVLYRFVFAAGDKRLILKDD